jgi:hypothetical protein
VQQGLSLSGNRGNRFWRSLAIRERVFSPSHPAVKQSRDNLAEQAR